MRFLILLLLLMTNDSEAKCQGRMINPISDICWKCLFPIRVAGVEIVSSDKGDHVTTRKAVCNCFRPAARMNIPGIPVSFWEPVRLIDVTREPYCMVSLGGIQLSKAGIRKRGEVHNKRHHRGQKESFYQVHWYIYPIVYWLEVLMDFLCLDNAAIDVCYFTEPDPLWNDEKKAFVLAPEAALFGNPIAQASCGADCVAASAKKGLASDALFWCNGCQGSIYPFTGMIPNHSSGVQASLLTAGKFMAKMHRELQLWGTIGDKGLCGKYPMPFIKKSQYRFQMTYPVPGTQNCYGFGHTEVTWQGGKEYPYKGEDFAYLIWRKRDCCLL